jgi:hypothetical protein
VRTLKLVLDHTRTVKGKRVTHKAGEVIQVSVEEYDRIVAMTRDARTALQARAAKLPGTPEWRKALK